MKHDFEDLLIKADFTKESGLCGKLEQKLFSRCSDDLRNHRLADEDLEELAAAGAVDLARLKPEEKRSGGQG